LSYAEISTTVVTLKTQYKCGGIHILQQKKAFREKNTLSLQKNKPNVQDWEV